MPVVLVQNESRSLIRVEGEINVTSATELKRLLTEALKSGKELRLDIERATELDITGLAITMGDRA